MPDLNIDDAVDEIGNDIFGQDVTENVTEEVVETEEPVVEQPVVEARPAPKSWAKEKHELWSKLDPAVQDQIELRETQALEGISAYKEYSGIGKQIRDVAAPYQQLLEQQGVDLPKAVSTLFAAHARLTTGSQEQRLAAYQELGRNLGLAQQTDIDPRVQVAIQAAQKPDNLLGTSNRRD